MREGKEKSPEKVGSIRHYLTIYAVLMSLLALNIGTAFWNFGPWRLALQLSVALAQDALIWIFYMHLSQEKTVIRLFALVGIIWFSILVLLTMNDFVSRSWLLFPARWPALMHFSPPL